MFSKPSSVSEFTYFYGGDPAFDSEHADFAPEIYADTGDLKHLPRKPGGPEPTAFTIRNLSKRERLWVQAKADEGALMIVYWAAALGVLDAKPILIDGKEHRLSRVKDGSVTHLSDYDMEILSSVDDGALLGELAKRILTEASADPS
jgi:hypothetical protein